MLTIGNSTFSNNSANQNDGGNGAGGAIFNLDIVFSMFNSTFNNNSALLAGGAISNCGLIIELTNSTIAGNTSAVIGGGIDNSCASAGSGKFNYGSRIDPPIESLTSNIIATNTAAAAGPDLYDPAPDIGFPDRTLIGLGAGNTITATPANHNIVGTTSAIDPLLGPLQYNGGLRWTMALSFASPAINTGDNPKGLEFD